MTASSRLRRSSDLPTRPTDDLPDPYANAGAAGEDPRSGSSAGRRLPRWDRPLRARLVDRGDRSAHSRRSGDHPNECKDRTPLFRSARVGGRIEEHSGLRRWCTGPLDPDVAKWTGVPDTETGGSGGRTSRCSTPSLVAGRLLDAFHGLGALGFYRLQSVCAQRRSPYAFEALGFRQSTSRRLRRFGGSVRPPWPSWSSRLLPTENGRSQVRSKTPARRKSSSLGRASARLRRGPALGYSGERS